MAKRQVYILTSGISGWIWKSPVNVVLIRGGTLQWATSLLVQNFKLFLNSIEAVVQNVTN